jgi:hypothetical protein
MIKIVSERANAAFVEAARHPLPNRPRLLHVLDFGPMARTSRPLLGLLFLLGLLSIKSFAMADEADPAAMVWISGETFTMGSNLPGSHRNEQPPGRWLLD